MHDDPPGLPDASPPRRSWSVRRVVAGVVFLLLLVLAVVLVWVDGQLRDAACIARDHGHIELDEMVALKQRVELHQASDDPEQVVSLDDREASFVLEGIEVGEADVEIDEDRLRLRIGLEAGAACYNVEYLGTLAVDAGVAHFMADRVIVGRLDLSPLLAGRPIVLRPEDMPGERSAAALRAVSALDVHEGLIRLRLKKGRR